MAPGSPRSNAPEPAAADAPGRVPLVGGGRLPLAFIGGGLLAFGAGALWLARSAWPGLPPHLHPEVVALAHLWLPGFLLSVCLGASYQLMPVVLGVPLRAANKPLWTHAALHLGGVLALVLGLGGGHYGWAGLGGAALSAGALYFFIVTLRTFRASRRRDAAAWSFPLAAGWLLATVLAGVLMAMNRRHPFLPLSALDLLRAHAHLGLVGYFVTLLQGVTFQLVPMFTMGDARRPRCAARGLIAAQGGLMLLVAGLVGGWRFLAAPGALLVLAGLAGTAAALHATLATRRRRRPDPGVLAFLLGMGLLGLAGIVGCFLVLADLAAERLFAGAAAYGLLVIAGGLSLTVLGMLCKILPFLVWMKAYGPRVGRGPVPVATTLSSRTLEQVWLGAHLAGLAGLAAGTAASIGWASAAGGALLATAAAIYLANAVRVIRHLRPARPAESAARPVPIVVKTASAPLSVL